MILGVADARLNRLRCDETLFNFQIFHGGFNDLNLVGFIIDRKIALVSERLNLAAKDAHT